LTYKVRLEVEMVEDASVESRGDWGVVHWRRLVMKSQPFTVLKKKT